MKIGFCFDAPSTHPGHVVNDDYDAEYENEETISAITAALSRRGEVIELPWHNEIFDDLRKFRPDVVFNIVESSGSRNRESLLPNLCEILKIPFTGSDGLALGASLDKELTKRIALSCDIPTPSFIKVEKLEDLRSLNIDFPLFIKPNHEGSSKGILRDSLVSEAGELKERVKKRLRLYRQPVLIEEYVPGRELVVSVLGNQKLEIFPPAEIRAGGGSYPFYSYEYKEEHQKEVTCPAEIAPELESEIIAHTSKLFRAMGCRDLCRTDFRLNEEGNPELLEINPLPGLSPYYSVYPLQAQEYGLSFENLISSILDFALNRGGKY